MGDTAVGCTNMASSDCGIPEGTEQLSISREWLTTYTNTILFYVGLFRSAVVKGEADVFQKCFKNEVPCKGYILYIVLYTCILLVQELHICL